MSGASALTGTGPAGYALSRFASQPKALVPDAEACPYEADYRRMMTDGSARLLRAMRGEPPENAKPNTLRRIPTPPKPRYVPVAFRPPAPMPRPVREIIEAVATRFKVGPNDVTGRGRQRRLRNARAVAIRLIRDRTWANGEPKHSTIQIGHYVGRDHSTVCWSLQNFDNYCRQFPDVKRVYEALREAA